MTTKTDKSFYSKLAFPYPKNALKNHGIRRVDWKEFMKSLNAVTDCGAVVGGMLACKIDEVLDVVALWNVQFFRPKGFVERMDMTGKEKYGLDFMDLYHYHHIDNMSETGEPAGAFKEHNRGKPPSTKRRHREEGRGRGFRCIRLVVEPIEVLADGGLSDVRGWTAWQESKVWKSQSPLYGKHH
jgi:hypothetical protein